MIKRAPLLSLSSLSSRSLWIGGLGVVAAAIIVACSSSTPTGPSGCTAGSTLACACAGGQSGTQLCGASACDCAGGGDSGNPGDVDAGATPDADNPGDATHRDDQAAPATTYGACALQGGFGWPCTSATTGPDPTECTDVNFPDCFVGGQGKWCTASCTDGGLAACPVETHAGDAGCTPVDCNARGYCK